MHRTIVLVTALFASPVAGVTPQSITDIAHRHAELSTALLQLDAGHAEVERLGELYDVDAVYEHPRVGIRIEGRAAISAGRRSFLGTTRNPVIEVLAAVAAPGAVVLHLRVQFEARSGDEWLPSSREQVQVLEFEDGLIRRVIDYW